MTYLLKINTLVIALLILATSNAIAQGPPQNVRAHRVGAGVFDKTGWTKAVSTEGRYSVELPCQFNDVTASPENGPSKGNDLAFIVACDRADGVRFFAARFQYPNGQAEAQKTFDQRFAGSPMAEGTFTDGQLQGLKLFDFALDGPGKCIFGRMVRAGGDNIMLLVEPVKAPATVCSSLRPDAVRFRSSLMVTR